MLEIFQSLMKAPVAVFLTLKDTTQVRVEILVKSAALLTLNRIH